MLWSMFDIDQRIHLGKSRINAYNALLGVGWTILCNLFHGAVHWHEHSIFEINYFYQEWMEKEAISHGPLMRVLTCVNNEF